MIRRNKNKSSKCLRFCVGLTYLLRRAVSGPKDVDIVQVHFFMPIRIAR